VPANAESVVIACAADDRYAQPLGVMVHSALVNLSPDRRAVVYVLDGGIAERHKQELARAWQSLRAVVHWLPVTAQSFTGVPVWGRMPVTTYFKLIVGELLPPAMTRVIWLDCDLLVIGDLARLWDTVLAGRHVLAAQDSVVPFVSSRNGVANYERLGIPRGAKYFNAGVMLIDLDAWRRDNVGDRVLEYLRRYRRSVVFWDQEGLNAVLAGRWGELDRRWNCNASKSRRSSDDCVTARDVWIVHFAGHLKPWLYVSGDPYRILYYKYLDMTPWAGWRPQPTLRSRLVRTYEGSAVRRALYPAEEWGLGLVRAVSRRYVTKGDA